MSERITGDLREYGKRVRMQGPDNKGRTGGRRVAERGKAIAAEVAYWGEGDSPEGITQYVCDSCHEYFAVLDGDPAPSYCPYCGREIARYAHD